MDRFVIRKFQPAVSTEPRESIQSSNSAKLSEKIDEGKSIGQAQQGKCFKNENSSSSEGIPYTEQTKEFERLDSSSSTKEQIGRRCDVAFAFETSRQLKFMHQKEKCQKYVKS